MPKDIEAKIKATKPQTMSIRVAEYEELKEQVAYWKKNAKYWDDEYAKLMLEIQDYEQIENLLPNIKKFIEGIENHKYTTLIELQEHLDDEIEVIKASIPAEKIGKPLVRNRDDLVDGLQFLAPQFGNVERNNARFIWNEVAGRADGQRTNLTAPDIWGNTPTQANEAAIDDPF